MEPDGMYMMDFPGIEIHIPNRISYFELEMSKLRERLRRRQSRRKNGNISPLNSETWKDEIVPGHQ
jgi:hypothetical protein